MRIYPNSMRKRPLHKVKLFVLFLVVNLSILGCAHMGYFDDSYKQIPAFHKVNDNLYRGGRPNLSGLMELKDLNVKTIVNFQNDKDDIQSERRIVEGLRFDSFYSIPLDVHKAPTDKQVLEFLDIVTDENNFPIFVHGESGRNITAAMIAMYRVVVERWTIKEAYKEAKALGFWPYYADAELKRFIHQLKDKDIYFRKVGREPPLP